MARLRELLKDKNFSFLWFSQIISNFGDRLNQMALIGLIYARTPGSTFELAKLLSFTVIPVFLIGPIAGSYVDRWDRKHTMIVCDLLRALLVAAIVITISYSENIILLYILVFLVFSTTRFFLPSKLSIIPDIVHKDSLLLANSLTSTTMMIATIVGFGFGGMIVGRLGAKGGFSLDVVTYLISAFMLSCVSIRVKRPGPASSSKEKLAKLIKKTVLGDIKEGVLYFRDHKEIRMVANTLFLIMAGAGSVYVIIIVFVQEALGSSTEHLGLLAMLLGAGLFLGSIAYGRFGSGLSKKKVINIGLALTGMVVVILAISLNLYPLFFVAGLLAVVIGISSSPIIISANTLLHEVMKDEMRGRIFSCLEIIMHAGFFVFMIMSSLIAEQLSKGPIIIATGLIFSVAGLLRFTRDVIREKPAG